MIVLLFFLELIFSLACWVLVMKEDSVDGELFVFVLCVLRRDHFDVLIYGRSGCFGIRHGRTFSVVKGCGRVCVMVR